MDEQNRNLVEVASASSRLNPDRWSALKSFEPNSRHISRRRIVSIRQNDPAHLAFDMMRTRTVMALRAKNWSALAITSPTPGCGKGTIALNLAVSMARQHDIRVVLVDLDLRRPRIASILGHDNEYSTEQFLKGACRIEEFFVRYGSNLAIGASRQAIAQPAELLHDQRTMWALRSLRQGLLPNFIIYNMPPMLTSDDFIGFLPNVDCAMLVIGADHSRTSDIDQCERELNEAGKLLGVVLNKCRYTDQRHGGY
jgi:Mrp family chromosome partitioning ATPase